MTDVSCFSALLIDGGKEVLLQVADKCPEGECKVDDIDMQEPAFIKLFGDLGVGRKGEGTTWQFV